MKINVNNVAFALTKFQIAPEKQGEYLTTAVARAVGYLLPIPAEKVENEQTYFKGTLEGMVAPVLDALIERFPFDFDQALAAVNAIWQVRYALVHDHTSSVVWALLDAACKQNQCKLPADLNDPAVQLLAGAITQNLE